MIKDSTSHFTASHTAFKSPFKPFQALSSPFKMTICIVRANLPIYQALIDEAESFTSNESDRFNAYKDAANIIASNTDTIYQKVIEDMQLQPTRRYLDDVLIQLDSTFMEDVQDFIINFVFENDEDTFTRA